MKTRETLVQAQQAMRARQQKELNRQRRVLLNLLAKMQIWERRIAAMSQCPLTGAMAMLCQLAEVRPACSLHKTGE